jgi:hypothetical protein
MFKKLNVNLEQPIFEYIEEASIAFKSKGLIKNTPPAICYNKIDGFIVQEMLNLIPDEFKDKFEVSVMEITKTLVPHIDSYIICSVNYYFNVDDERTVFYRVLENKQGFPIKHVRETGRLFHFSDVEEIDSFIAKSGEVWVLDVSKPHNLISSSKELINRRAIVLQTPHFTYEQVLEMIESNLNK